MFDYILAFKESKMAKKHLNSVPSEKEPIYIIRAYNAGPKNQDTQESKEISGTQSQETWK
jgi:hypothetical protein